MSLDYNYTHIVDYKKLHRSKWELMVSESIVWSALNIGLNGITDLNYYDWWVRSKITGGLYGAMINKGNKPYHITLADFKRRIGLSTNVSHLSKAAFFTDLKRRYDLQIGDAQYTQRLQERQAAEEAEKLSNKLDTEKAVEDISNGND